MPAHSTPAPPASVVLRSERPTPLWAGGLWLGDEGGLGAGAPPQEGPGGETGGGQGSRSPPRSERLRGRHTQSRGTAPPSPGPQGASCSPWVSLRVSTPVPMADSLFPSLFLQNLSSEQSVPSSGAAGGWSPPPQLRGLAAGGFPSSPPACHGAGRSRGIWCLPAPLPRAGQASGAAVRV